MISAFQCFDSFTLNYKVEHFNILAKFQFKISQKYYKGPFSNLAKFHCFSLKSYKSTIRDWQSFGLRLDKNTIRGILKNWKSFSVKLQKIVSIKPMICVLFIKKNMAIMLKFCFNDSFRLMIRFLNNGDIFGISQNKNIYINFEILTNWLEAI